MRNKSAKWGFQEHHSLVIFLLFLSSSVSDVNHGNGLVGLYGWGEGVFLAYQRYTVHEFTRGLSQKKIFFLLPNVLPFVRMRSFWAVHLFLSESKQKRRIFFGKSGGGEKI